MKTTNCGFWAVVIATTFIAQPLASQWTQTNGPFGEKVNALAVAGNQIIAGTSGGVFVSTDHGVTWSGMNTGLSKRPFPVLNATAVLAVG